jgi:hypothetical protein
MELGFEWEAPSATPVNSIAYIGEALPGFDLRIAWYSPAVVRRWRFDASTHTGTIDATGTPDGGVLRFSHLHLMCQYRKRGTSAKR